MADLSISSRIKYAWDAFVNNRDPTRNYYDYGPSYSYRPDRVRFTKGKEQTIINAIYNRIAIDAASINIQHVRTDENGRFVSTIESGLNNCFNLEANIDQTGRAFRQDIFMSLLDEGAIAIVPVDFETKKVGLCNIATMRVAKILEWRPAHIKIRIYNDITGNQEEVIVPKKMVEIVENPFYSVMNETSSTMQRLARKLALLDAVDEQSGAGKLDLIIQLPYTIRTESRRVQAENRRKDIENQLEGSKYGIAYTDATERVTQLNRPIENNLMKQIEFLTSTLYSQLGITKEIMEGTAGEEAMLNYYNRTIEPLVAAVVDGAKRTFLTKTARTQGQSIMFFRDPFKLVPLKNMAEIADSFTRNEIMSSNEVRQIIGMKPSDKPEADELRNKNLNKDPALNLNGGYDEEQQQEEEVKNQNGEM